MFTDRSTLILYYDQINIGYDVNLHQTKHAKWVNKRSNKNGNKRSSSKIADTYHLCHRSNIDDKWSPKYDHISAEKGLISKWRDTP